MGIRKNHDVNVKRHIRKTRGYPNFGKIMASGKRGTCKKVSGTGKFGKMMLTEKKKTRHPKNAQEPEIHQTHDVWKNGASEKITVAQKFEKIMISRKSGTLENFGGTWKFWKIIIS